MIEVVGKFVFGNKSNRTGAIRFRVVFFLLEFERSFQNT